MVRQNEEDQKRGELEAMLRSQLQQEFDNKLAAEKQKLAIEVQQAAENAENKKLADLYRASMNVVQAPHAQAPPAQAPLVQAPPTNPQDAASVSNTDVQTMIEANKALLENSIAANKALQDSIAANKALQEELAAQRKSESGSEKFYNRGNSWMPPPWFTDGPPSSSGHDGPPPQYRNHWGGGGWSRGW
jgi:hypothetical protein